MNRTLKLGTIVFAAFALNAFAEGNKASSESKLKIEEVRPEKNKAPGEDVDEIITNKKMRADSGSKSKYSISNSLNYAGGTLEKPLAENRPNITRGTGNTDVANLTDTISGKFALDQRHAFLAGFGARWITPLQGSESPQGYNGQKFDAYDPYVNYQYVYKWSGIQSVFLTGPTFTTQTNLQNIGFVGNWIFQQNNAYEIGTSGVTVGLLAKIQLGAFNKNDPQFLSNQSDYTVGLYPFLEYVINDRFNLRTISGVWNYEHVRSEPRAGTFNKNTIYQSVGLGISVMRDIFLYPNIQFIPEDIRADRTNVALNASINLF